MILMLRLTLGWALIGVGAVILPTPVPIGLIMLIVGLALVAPESKRLQGWLRRRRAANPDLSARLAALAPKLPRLARRVIDLTDPEAPLATAPERTAGGSPAALEPPSSAVCGAVSTVSEAKPDRAAAAAGDSTGRHGGR